MGVLFVTPAAYHGKVLWHPSKAKSAFTLLLQSKVGLTYTKYLNPATLTHLHFPKSEGY